jgi:hypothetical protein
MMMRVHGIAIAVASLGLASPLPAAAQDTASVEQANRQLAHEPTVSETTQEALRYFRVDPDNFDGLRSSARNRALLPLLAGGFRYDQAAFGRAEERTIFQPANTDESTDTRVMTFSIGGVWDLRELVFNASEVQVYGLIGVQRDIMLESIRTYYLRRQLMLRMLLRPPEDPLALAALEMRIDEFTAVLDVLTGGWFSEEAARRRGR